MQFNSLEYMVFLGIVLILYYRVARTFAAQRMLIILSSALFYAFWSAAFLVHFLIVVGLNYWISLLMEERKDRGARLIILWTGIAANLFNLGFFKYSGLAVDTVNWFFAMVGHSTAIAKPGIILPLAISFYTFHAISYLVDRYHDCPASKANGLLDFLFYIMLFPHQIAGPILRGHELFPQLGYRAPNSHDLRDGFHRLLIGLFQKSVIADNLAVVADHGFQEYQTLSPVETYVVLVAYAFQIFFDFSGYTHMGIGSAKLLGYTLPENFNYPYLADSISEFWRSWHMTLSRWVRDYIYIPLGGSRGTQLRIAVNLVITMALVGLWHGAAWTFVVWGIYHGIGLAAHHFYERTAVFRFLRQQVPGWVYRGAAILLTFHFVTFGWALFRAPDFVTALRLVDHLRGLFALSGWHLDQAYLFKTYGFTAMILYGLATLAFQSERISKAFRERLDVRVPTYSLALYLIIVLAPVHTDPFIYFQF